MSSLAIALMFMAGLQGAPGPDRSRAEELARAGRTTEAVVIFEQIVEANPGDLEARLWVARLALRLGRTEEAESEFRSVVSQSPHNVDARIGLATVLTRTGAWRDAIAILTDTARDAGENAEFYSALARAYRRGGDDRRALEEFERARTLAPGDDDVIRGFEATARAYGHWVGFAGLAQSGSPDAGLASGSFAAGLRVANRLHLDASARRQRGDGYTDTIAGGGVVWGLGPSTTVTAHVLGGPDNVALPTSDLSADVLRHIGTFELGGSFRRMNYADSTLRALSPIFAWDREPWRLDVRYTYSRTVIPDSDTSHGDHSAMLRGTWQRWLRAALQGAVAYGIDNFDDLTADRLTSLGATMVSGGVRVDLPSLTRLAVTYEHQWRSNDATVERLAVTIVQCIP